MDLRRRATVRWAGRDHVFHGEFGEGGTVDIDSASAVGPSPMEALLLSLGGCMAVDILDILEKGRVSVHRLEVEVEGDRAPEPPRRYTSLRLTVRLDGPQDRERGKVERAVQLSREKYCSVFHTLRPDMDVEIRISALEG